MKQAAPVLIAPECFAAGCHHDGDQHLMIKCRSCGHWFCDEHLEPAQSAESSERGGEQRSQRVAAVPTVKLVDTGLQGLAYYLGYCRACREQQSGRRPVDSSWLR